MPSDQLRFTFKTLDYQTEAVNNIVKVFEGQKYIDGILYRHDIGDQKVAQATIDPETGLPITDFTTAYRNNDLLLSTESILSNINSIQKVCGIPLSKSIVQSLGKVTLDIEMETGTGKTFVYTKAMFELNAKYGWSKFIIVVPSIAIREGVYKSIQITESYFMEQYGKKLRAFIYDSSNLTKVDDFAQNSGINVMIINSQAFARDFDESKDKDGKKGKLIIFDRRDEFASRRPIDIIRSTRPILILDEPQKLGKTGSKTQESLRKNFDALFSMNFSATHVEEHNKIYSLDALDAYNHKLVKKISVKGIKINHLTGSEGYIYVEGIELFKDGPKARLEINVNHKNGISKETHLFGYKYNLYQESNQIEAYRDLFITDINALENTVSFSNGFVLHPGESVCDILEEDKRHIQIRETILSHLNRENELFKKGIKVLSLFFIDEVSNYRKYDDFGEPVLGEYGVMFEEEFRHIIKERGAFYDPDYIAHLLQNDVSQIHTGYFSVDKKGRMVNSEIKRGYEESSDDKAYDLILRNKEELLRMGNPVRFIFSHSALSEGWDNPNVFQICALKHSDSNTRRRQEVGRGMRICVNQRGERQDVDALGPEFFKVNSLTVIADEDYKTFVDGLQKETLSVIRPRSVPLTPEYLQQRFSVIEKGEVDLNTMEAKILYRYLTSNNYLDYDDLPTDAFRDAVQNNDLKPLPLELAEKSDGIKRMLGQVAQPESIKDMYEDGRKVKIRSNALNDNFKKFLALWNEINHMYHYKVSFDSEELINHSVAHINDKLNIVALSYTVTEGTQRDEISYQQSLGKQGFNPAKTSTKSLDNSHIDVKYDLIGRITAKTGLTRRTIATILKRIEDKKFDMFKTNPEEFIEQVSKLINEKKATIVIDHIEYNMVEGKFDNDIFTMNRPEIDFDKAYEAKKNIQDYVFTDSNGERTFAEDLDGADEVVVYAKLPDGKNGFFIPTPMGNYSPDWAVAFNKDQFRHIFFVAETKGSLSTMDLSPIEQSKIKCAQKLFDKFNGDATYHQTKDYKDLIDFVMGQNQ